MSSVEQVLAGEARWCVVRHECVAAMMDLPDGCVDHVITDPPYSAHVHKSVRSSGRNQHPDVAEFACRARRTVDLGFEHITDEIRDAVTRQVERVCKRWFAVFSDVESATAWRDALDGFDYVRTAAWIRIGGAPQFTGDRPASGFEAITLAHRKGRKRWNGGGKAGVYHHPIVANRLGQRGSRVHPTQKPLGLMVDLIEDFTDPDDVVLDPFCGSGTTGVACIQRGRRFIGIELDSAHAETARARLAETHEGLVIANRRMRQERLFGDTAP